MWVGVAVHIDVSGIGSSRRDVPACRLRGFKPSALEPLITSHSWRSSFSVAFSGGEAVGMEGG